jgi:MoaA/NifB/PqqE/SkfB family radical SAM enzyme
MTDMGWRYLTAADKADVLRGVADGVAHGGPFHVEIYPADRCNIDCFFCSTAAIRGTDELPMQRIEELIDELKRAGTRAIRLSGGGEPLFHRSVKPMLERMAASGIPLENITTNAVLLGEDIAKILVRCCDQVTVSLNTADAESYAKMMQTPARNFDRVLQNIRTLIRVRNESGSTKPRVQLQYLVWKENFRTIPQMYALARDLGVDTIIFNGLSWLRPDQEMTDDEVREMLSMYEDLVRKDEFRYIRNIESYERDISGEIDAMIRRVAAERNDVSLMRKAIRFLRREGSLRSKISHMMKVRRDVRADRAVDGFDESCVIGWYSMVIRSDGTIGPCCVLQGKPLGNIFKQSVDEIWNGDAYRDFRGELSRIMSEGEKWKAAGNERVVDSICAAKSGAKCPMRSYYFIRDVPFVKELDREFAAKRAGRASS